MMMVAYNVNVIQLAMCYCVINTTQWCNHTDYDNNNNNNDDVHHDDNEHVRSEVLLLSHCWAHIICCMFSGHLIEYYLKSTSIYHRYIYTCIIYFGAQIVPMFITVTPFVTDTYNWDLQLLLLLLLQFFASLSWCSYSFCFCSRDVTLRERKRERESDNLFFCCSSEWWFMKQMYTDQRITVYMYSVITITTIRLSSSFQWWWSFVCRLRNEFGINLALIIA